MAISSRIKNNAVKGNKTLANVGGALANFGSKISSSGNKNSAISSIGSKLSSFGSGIQLRANSRMNPKNKEGLTTRSVPNRLHSFGNRMLASGQDSLQSAIDTIIPTRNMYRRRNRFREE